MWSWSGRLRAQHLHEDHLHAGGSEPAVSHPRADRTTFDPSVTISYQYREFGIFRLFLAICVVVQHAIVNVAPVGRLRTALAPYEIGSVAVLVFFCLSGFVITEAARQVYAAKPFAYLINRLLRIVPHFLVAVAIGIGLHALFFSAGSLRSFDRAHPELVTGHMFEWSNLAANLIAFVPGSRRLMNLEFVGIIWAVRVEMVFYLVVFICLLVPLCLRNRLDRLIPVSLIAALVGMLLVSRHIGFFYFFLYGALLFNWRRYKPALIGCTIGMTVFIWLGPAEADAGYSRAVMTQYLLLVGLVSVMTWLAVRSGTYRRIDQRCGDLTYPLYVYHEDIIVLMLSITAGYSNSIMVAAIVLAVLASYGLMRLVDPGVNRLRDLIRGKRLRPPKEALSPRHVSRSGLDATRPAQG
jgi:peptidoglycan/LPS O-acetylase OafA/YrhL